MPQEQMKEDRIAKLLDEMVKLTRFLALREAHKIAQEVLDTDTKQQVYNLSDGTKTVREIAEIAKINKNTVSEWWREWEAVGLVEVANGTKTRKAIFPLKVR